MRFVALATDYDETLADDGRVVSRTVEALQRLKASGRRLLLVTGRELDDLLSVFPGAASFDAIVAENGALLHLPQGKRTRQLAEPRSAELVAALQRRGVPLSVGRVVVATRVPHETEVLEEIRRLGLELQVIFNKGAVMVLPSGVNKASGLVAALLALGLSPHNAVAVGDGENDHVFLKEAECGAAVANAVPMLRERADLVLRGHAAEGVEELIDHLLRDDLRSALASRPSRRDVTLGEAEGGGRAALPPTTGPLLIAGGSGGGKSTAVKGIVERQIDEGYQVCIVDPEGDWEGFDRTVQLGDPERPPTLDEVTRALDLPGEQVVLGLTAVPRGDRPAFLAGLLPRLLELRARTGRPHFIVLDEAHHFLPRGALRPVESLPADLRGVVAITVLPHELARPFLERVEAAIGIGTDAGRTLADFCAAVQRSAPPAPAPALRRGEALLLRAGASGTERIRLLQTRAAHLRHLRKYAEGDLPQERSFFFRGPDHKLNLRARNVLHFQELGEGVDDETWSYHLRRGDYSRWFRESLNDDQLAIEAARVEADSALDPAGSRAQVRTAIERRYTLPAGS